MLQSRRHATLRMEPTLSRCGTQTTQSRLIPTVRKLPVLLSFTLKGVPLMPVITDLSDTMDAESEADEQHRLHRERAAALAEFRRGITLRA